MHFSGGWIIHGAQNTSVQFLYSEVPDFSTEQSDQFESQLAFNCVCVCVCKTAVLG